VGTRWRWRRYVPSKRWYLPTSPHGVTAQKTKIDIFSVVRISDCIWVHIYIFRNLIQILKKETGNEDRTRPTAWLHYCSFSDRQIRITILVFSTHETKQRNVRFDLLGSKAVHCLTTTAAGPGSTEVCRGMPVLRICLQMANTRYVAVSTSDGPILFMVTCTGHLVRQEKYSPDLLENIFYLEVLVVWTSLSCEQVKSDQNHWRHRCVWRKRELWINIVFVPPPYFVTKQRLVVILCFISTYLYVYASVSL
jgi:hypothetical protein